MFIFGYLNVAWYDRGPMLDKSVIFIQVVVYLLYKWLYKVLICLRQSSMLLDTRGHIDKSC
jgi:hypothetical protein